MSKFTVPEPVRLVNDPSRRGVLTGRSKPGRPGELRHQVVFPDGALWVPEDQLELVPDLESPVDLLRNAKLSDTATFRQTLTHIRLTGRLADLLYSMEMTNTDFHAYQFKPLLRFLSSPSNGILIADEVGLGKTIEAGLIWTELRSRENATRLAVFCPKTLVEKWRRELSHRFGVTAVEANASQLLDLLGDPKSMERGFAVICSLGIKPFRGWSEAEKPTRPADKLAHLLDRAGSGGESYCQMMWMAPVRRLRLFLR